MWLKSDEYARGFLHWDESYVQGVTVHGERLTAAKLHLSDEQKYIILDSTMQPEVIEIVPHFSEAAKQDDIHCWLEWIDEKGDIQCRMWARGRDGAIESSTFRATGFGFFHRLVIDGAGLEWDQDRVFRRSNDILRFAHGTVSGHRAVFKGSQEGQEGLSTGIEVGPITMKTQFIEVVTQGASESLAQRAAYAIVGYVSLMFGKAAMGEVIFDAGLDMSKDRGVHMTEVYKLPWLYKLDLPASAFSVGLAHLESVLGDNRKAVGYALERYAQAKRTRAKELQFAAHFSGIELLVRQYERKRGGLPEVNKLVKKHQKAFEKFLNMVGDHNLKQKILGSLKHVPVDKAFNFYMDENSIDTDDRQRFKQVAKARNDMFHTGAVKDLHEHNQTAMRLLQRMLEHELGIPANTSWNKFPEFELTAPMLVENYGWGSKWGALDKSGTDGAMPTS